MSWMPKVRQQIVARRATVSYDELEEKFPGSVVFR